MKKIFVFSLLALFLFIFATPLTWAQESKSKESVSKKIKKKEFTLEKVVVTAEKRVANVQSVPDSIQVLLGNNLIDQGKVTVKQLLENVPNLKWTGLSITDYGRGGPNSNLAIRGVQRTQEAGGPGPLPSTVSTYVDGVFAGVGGDFDINRIEVLRGPQGTLYGRSATAGVVSFYTNNPKLSEFGGYLSVDYGSGQRLDTQGAINIPVGDKLAFRVAYHYFDLNKGIRLGDKGKGLKTKEARIKVLYQPNDKFNALLSLTASDVRNKAGGWSYNMPNANTIDYTATHTTVGDALPQDYRQASLQLNYDLGQSSLTYIGAYHTLKMNGLTGELEQPPGTISQSKTGGDPFKTMTHELRWTSHNNSPLSWLFGANYYSYKYKWSYEAIQDYLLADNDPATFNVDMFEQYNKGSIKDFGLFTQETYKLRKDLRFTVGGRYDQTRITVLEGYDFNLNMKSNGADLNPPIIAHFPQDSFYTGMNPKNTNWTYKLRLDYDLTPKNMLYALTATGFMPGTAVYTVLPLMGPLSNGGFGVTDVEFLPFYVKQSKLTSYEIGSKNRFLNDTLQLNGDIFYMKYQGYQEALNINPPSQPPPPKMALMSVPLKVYGLEMDCSWLMTMYDKVTLTGGWLRNIIDGYPPVPVPGETGVTTSAKQYMALKRMPGFPDLTANLTYEHTFLLGNGSTLVPRGELRYNSGYYVTQITELQAQSGFLSYDYQKATSILDFGLTWTSPTSKYSITGYVRNATDEVYKTKITFPNASSPVNPVVYVNNPRMYGMVLRVHF